MCAACARCREAETLDWAPLMHEIFDLHRAPVDWPGGKLAGTPGARKRVG